MEEIREILLVEQSPASIFNAVRTKKLMDRFLIEQLHMVPAYSLKVGVEHKWKQKKVRGRVQPWLCEVDETAYVVPFLKNLENLLKNDDVRSNVDNPRRRPIGVYQSVLDGEYYTTDEFFQSNKNAIAIVLYQDDVSMTNYFSGVSKEYKLSIFYWTMVNIYPEHRSSTNIVQLYAIAKAKYLKKPGVLSKVLQPFIQDIQTLKTDGINIEINNVVKNYKGIELRFLAY